MLMFEREKSLELRKLILLGNDHRMREKCKMEGQFPDTYHNLEYCIRN